MSKIQQLDKTVVTELTVQVADLYIRQKYMKAAISAKIPQTDNLMQADATVTNSKFVTLSNINTVIVINCWSPILLDLYNDTGLISDVPCNGLFINYGQFNQIVIKGVDAIGTRLSYVCS
jgi:hypothetical protein